MTRQSKTVKAERIAQAFEFRKAGMSLREIAARLDVSHETVRKDIIEMTEQFIEEARVHHRTMVAMEMMRLDDMAFGIWPAATMGDVKAIEAMLKIMERRAKMLGVDAQTLTKNIQVQVTPEQLTEMSDDELQQLIQQFR
jgi:predicted DNA-binding transcriptional regulator YafY